MNIAIYSLALILLGASNAPAADNPLFQELTEKGITTSDGSVVKLPPPILTDGLDAAAQRAAIDNAGDSRASFAELIKQSYYTPVVVKVRTPKPNSGEGPSVRTIDLWFIVRGDWNKLTSKEFLESIVQSEEGKSKVVSKSGVLTDPEMAERKLAVAKRPGYEERFLYATFSLFERVEVSATRLAGFSREGDVLLAAARVDPRFDKDPAYPNQWRPLLRNERAEIQLGTAHPFAHAGGYAKISRLKDVAAAFIECHMVYEEPYGWFEGLSLVKQKLPVMVQEKVRIFRRKLAMADNKKSR